MNNLFRRFAQHISKIAGSPKAFALALAIIIVWAISGPIFGFSDTWQLMINTGTTILTFLMVFLIQNTQNRDSHAIHLKLDELINAIDSARNQLIDIEDSTDEAMELFDKEFDDIRETHTKILKKEESA